jgi:hypothetical protein
VKTYIEERVANSNLLLEPSECFDYWLLVIGRPIELRVQWSAGLCENIGSPLEGTLV